MIDATRKRIATEGQDRQQRAQRDRDDGDDRDKLLVSLFVDFALL